MLSLDRRMTFEVEFNHVAIAVAQMLVRQMDDAFLWLIDQADTQLDGPQHHSAEAANRIVVLCRRLVDELQRYERWERVWREQEDAGFEEQDLPF